MGFLGGLTPRKSLAYSGDARLALRRGLSLVELLVVIAIISMLTALMLPAVNAARESGRRTQCVNNVKQLGLAMLLHESSLGRFPSNGWGYLWIGEPDRGTGPEQPGGWIYNILSYLERSDLRELGRGQDSSARRASLASLTRNSLAILRCPNRGPAGLAPQSPGAAPYNAAWSAQVARTDYAVNEGDYVPPGGPGPPTLAEGDDPAYTGWDDTSLATGICHQRSRVKMGQISDGASRTYMLGEKYVSVGGYGTADDHGYDQSPFCGEDWDINRWTIRPPKRDGSVEDPQIFGSAHPSGCNMAFCDGSVRTISFAIDPAVHRSLGNRQDGMVFGDNVSW